LLIECVHEGGGEACARAREGRDRVGERLDSAVEITSGWPFSRIGSI